MQFQLTVVTWIIFIFIRVSSEEISNLLFPESFSFGAGSSSYQVEGAWNENGKGPSRWDYLVHNTSAVVDGSTGDVACDSYHRYEEDIAALKGLGVNHYRFSISWPRLLPSGFANRINPAGVKYYNNLIDGLLAEGIEPWITMYHWDLPQSIQYLGGWNNDKIIEYFTSYADLLFHLFGDRVKTWLTINEPFMFCAFYTKEDISIFGQMNVPSGVTEYMCAHNVIRAHARVYRLYQYKYRRVQKGRIGIVLDSMFGLPASSAEEDILVTYRKREFELGWFLHPLVYGDYPQVMIDRVRHNSFFQGYPFPRLPNFTPEEIKEIRGAYDLIAINHYTSLRVKPSNNSAIGATSYEDDVGVFSYLDPSWERSPADWLRVYPQGFRLLLRYLKVYCRNPEIVVTEQGYPDLSNVMDDTKRINYLRLYLSEALKAIYEDGVRLTAYTVWSLLDHFEWYSGYTIGFGLYHVDLQNGNNTRIPKRSAGFYKNVIATRSLIFNDTT